MSTHTATCPKCGGLIFGGVGFCNRCGTRVEPENPMKPGAYGAVATQAASSRDAAAKTPVPTPTLPPLPLDYSNHFVELYQPCPNCTTKQNLNPADCPVCQRSRYPGFVFMLVRVGDLPCSGRHIIKGGGA